MSMTCSTSYLPVRLSRLGGLLAVLACVTRTTFIGNPPFVVATPSPPTPSPGGRGGFYIMSLSSREKDYRVRGFLLNGLLQVTRQPVRNLSLAARLLLE